MPIRLDVKPQVPVQPPGIVSHSICDRLRCEARSRGYPNWPGGVRVLRDGTPTIGRGAIVDAGARIGYDEVIRPERSFRPECPKRSPIAGLSTS